MKRSIFARAVLCSALFALSVPAYSQEEVSARLGHVYANGSPQDRAAQSFVDSVRELTSGTVDIEVFPNGQLGGDAELGRSLSRGTLEFSFVSVATLSGMDPLLGLFLLPYIVGNNDEADAAFFNKEGVIQRTISKAMLDKGIKPLAFYELGFRAVTNSRRPVHTAKDLQGLSLRLSDSESLKAFFNAAGVQTVTIPFPELFTALQQGTVDGQDNGPSLTYASRLFEAQKHMTLTNHAYSIGAIAVSAKVWSQLSDEQKSSLQKAADEAAQFGTAANREYERETLSEMRKAGIEIVEPTPDQLEEFRAIGRSVWDDLSSTYGKDLVEELRAETEALDKE